MPTDPRPIRRRRTTPRVRPLALTRPDIELPQAMARDITRVPAGPAPRVERESILGREAPFFRSGTEEGGGDNFDEALRFTLMQEAEPGMSMAEAQQSRTGGYRLGGQGIDPIAEEEFASRHPNFRFTAPNEHLNFRFFNSQAREGMADSEVPPHTMNDWVNKHYTASVYRDIWDNVGAARLPRRLGLVHFDTAVHSGPGRAQQLLEASGGDPERYLELRETFLAGREKAKDNPGWFRKRMPALRRAITPKPNAP